MAESTLRLATAADIRPIADMSRCLIELGLRGWSWNPARVTAALHHRECSIVVAEVHGDFAGFAIGEFGDAQLHLSLLAVAPVHQRKGIARTLLQWLEQSALTAGIGQIQLELRVNNHAARCFYETHGFAVLRKVSGYYQGQESALRMGKHIGQPIAPTAKHYKISY
jgi:ribosomal-protein-alanine N-acetyltransferase